MGLFPDLVLSFWVCLLRCFCPKKVWFTNIPIVDRPRNPSSYSLESLQGLKWSSVSYFICLLKNCVSLCDNACGGQRTTLCGSLSHSPPCFLGQDRSLNWSSPSRDLPVSISPHCHTWLLHGFRVLMLEWQRPYPLNQLFSPHLSSMLEQN